MSEVIVIILQILSLLLIVVAGVGLIRLPDFYCRSHALGKAMALGIILQLTALWVHLGLDTAGMVLPLAIVFQLITIPVASHLLCQLAKRKQIPNFCPKDAQKEEKEPR